MQPLLDWYDAGHRDLPWRTLPTPYRVWVSEIMLQQTRVEAVGLGYYSRVRNLHRAAVLLCEQYGGELPADYDKLLSLPGVGEYTAGAVASIAFGLPVPAVDGNVLRVAARLSSDFTPITDTRFKKQTRERFAALMPSDRPGDLNQALMELGATVCVPNGAPHCGDCPIQHLCEGFHRGNAAVLPLRAAKKARRAENRTVLLVRCGELVGLRQRPKKGLLAGLWELPSLDGHLTPDELRAALTEMGWSVRKLLSLRPAKHIFTHVEWHMNGVYVELDEPAPALTFVTPAALRADYALPSAFRSFVSVLED